MILEYENINKFSMSSYKIFRINKPKLNSYWHYHSEIEIVYVVKGNGLWMIGNNIRRFRKGELLIIGQNIPHNFISDKDALDNEIETICIQFSRKQIEQLPESILYNDFFNDSDRGISIPKMEKKEIALISKMEKYQGQKIISLISFLKLLTFIKKTPEKQHILENKYHNNKLILQHSKRINSVLDYIHSNYQRHISLTEIAEVAHYTPHSFTRWFKKKMNLTFINYLHKIRLAHACQLLISTNNAINQVASQSGFENTNTFNRLFKKQMCYSPTIFRRINANMPY